MDLRLPCEDPSINDVVPIWNPTVVANAERIRLQGINFLNIKMDCLQSIRNSQLKIIH